MGRHGRRPASSDSGTVALKAVPGRISLYPRPGESAVQKAAWVGRSWTLNRVLAADDRLFGLMPYDCEVGSKPALDPRTGRRRGRRATA